MYIRAQSPESQPPNGMVPPIPQTSHLHAICMQHFKAQPPNCTLFTAFGKHCLSCTLLAAVQNHNLVTGPWVAVCFYPKPVYVLPTANLTHDLLSIVCRLYTQSIPMHTYVYLNNAISFMLACSMYLQIRVYIHICIQMLKSRQTHIYTYITTN